MRLPIAELFRRRLAQTVLALYVVQAATYLVPFVTVPYVARVLGPSEWGRLAVAQAIGSYVMIVVEFGFALSGTREVARHRADRLAVAEVFSSIMAAKVALTVAASLIVLTVAHFVPMLGGYSLLLAMALVWAIARGFSLMWFFQGLERVRFAATMEVVGAALASGAIFVVVRTAADGWKVLLCQAAGSALSFLVLSAVVWKEFPLRWPRLRAVWQGLAMGGSMFIFRSAVSLYTIGNALILSLFVPPQIVGYYAGAEKISKAIVNMMQPVTQAVFPRVSHLVQHAREDAERLIRLSALVMGLGGVLVGGVCFAFAPLLVHLILGSQFGPAIIVLRILSLLPPLIALSNVLGIQWMIPLGMDHAFNKIIIAAGVFNVALAFLLAPRFQDIGMAVAVVIAETGVTAGAYWALRLRGVNPMSGRSKPAPVEESVRAI